MEFRLLDIAKKHRSFSIQAIKKADLTPFKLDFVLRESLPTPILLLHAP